MKKVLFISEVNGKIQKSLSLMGVMLCMILFTSSESFGQTQAISENSPQSSSIFTGFTFNASIDQAIQILSGELETIRQVADENEEALNLDEVNNYGPQLQVDFLRDVITQLENTGNVTRSFDIAFNRSQEFVDVNGINGNVRAFARAYAELLE